jgi:hypothetical protein
MPPNATIKCLFVDSKFLIHLGNACEIWFFFAFPFVFHVMVLVIDFYLDFWPLLYIPM